MAVGVQTRLATTILVVAVALLALAIVTHAGDFVQALSQLAPSMLALALVCSLVNYLLRFLRWEVFLRQQGFRLDLRTSGYIFFTGLSAAITPGKIGELSKGYLLKAVSGNKVGRGLAVVVAERYLDIVAVLALTLIPLAAYPQTRFLLVPSLVVGVVLVLAVALPRLLPSLSPRLVKRLFLGRASLEQETREAMGSLQMLLRGRSLAFGVGVSLVAWFAECLALFVILRGLGAGHVTMPEATIIYAAGTLAGALSLLPGGLGVSEVGMIALLRLFGVQAGVAVAATLLVRACTLWFAVLLGIAGQRVLRPSQNAPGALGRRDLAAAATGGEKLEEELR
jgi:glycosyltransferase 2 family protein